jgi:hypothetical protein
VGKEKITSAAVVCRTPNSFPLPNGFRAVPVTELGWHGFQPCHLGANKSGLSAPAALFLMRSKPATFTRLKLNC